MAFSAEQVAQRQASIDAKQRAADEERESHEQWRREREELKRRLVSQFPGVSAYHLTELWDCAVTLTDKLIKDFTSGAEQPSSQKLAWAVVFRGDGVKDLSAERLAIIEQMARDYNDVGQTFLVENVNNRTLPIKDKANSPQVRVRCSVNVDS